MVIPVSVIPVSTNFRESKSMNNRLVIWLLATVLLATVSLAKAQQPTKKIPRVGFLSLNTASVQKERVEAFREALRKLGYVEGQNIIIDYRFADSKSERLPALAAELVALKVDVIVTAGNSATAPAKEATTTIPIVMMNDTDPVGQGHIDSLARPGGNVTGLNSISFDLADKRLELLKEIVPKLSRVAVLRDLTNQAVELAGREIDPTARALRLQVQRFDLAKVEDFDSQFKAITKWRAGGLVVGGGPLMIRYRKRVIEFATKSKLPAIYGREEFVEDGGLLNYSASVIDLTRRSATYVDKILKGTKPADLPVEQPMKFELIINLKAAKQIGLTIPPNVLARAERVIREAPG
jgi:putative tryptophan/tyrosine transport system substrate-binding protein